MGYSKRRLDMGEEKWAEYQKERKNKKVLKYRRGNADKVVNWRRRAKIKLIHYKGGKCQKCGYDKKIPSAYDFHHRIPSEKEFGIGGSTLALKTLKKEADKCDLLCKLCHMEIHEADYQEQREKTIKEWSAFADKV